MLQFAYLGSLLFSLGGLLVADCCWKLVVFADWRRAGRAIGPCWLVFLAWDILGVHFSIFFMGTSRFMTGWQVLPNVPLEELFFLLLLSYLPLLLWEGFTGRKHV